MLWLTLGLSVTAQKVPKLLEKAMAVQAPSEIEFYSDEELTDKIESISDGTYEFYVKVPIKKNLAQKCQHYLGVEVSLDLTNERTGVYSHYEDLPEKMMSYAKGDGYLTYKIDLKNEGKADLIWYYIQDAEQKEYELVCKFDGGRNRNIHLATGTLKFDLTSGNKQYLDYLLSRNADFNFDYEDQFIDNELKAELINHFKSLKKITITNFAWGERVPYTRDGVNYRRHTAAITYKDDNDGRCYSAGLSVFTDTPYPRTDYKFDGESVYINNSELIPCDNI